MHITTTRALILATVLTSGALAIPPSVEAQPTEQTQSRSPFAFIREGLSSIFGSGSSASPSPLTTPIVDEECSADAPLQCREPVTAVCNIQKPENRIPQIDAAIKRRFFPREHRTPQARLNAYIGAAREAENQVYSQSPVTRDDVQGLFDNLRTNLRGLIAQNPNIPQNQRQRMYDQLGAVQFYVSGPEYMASELARRRTENPTSPDNEQIENTTNGYSGFCEQGMGINALNRGNKIHLCPGMIQSLIDRRSTREEMMNALAFTIGHELSHSIGPNNFPDLYKTMGECYGRLNNDPHYWNGRPRIDTPDAQSGHNHNHHSRAEEIVADYWGTQLLAQRMASQGVTGESALRTIAHATDDFCNNDHGPGYATGNDRIGQTVVRNPTIREALGCGSQPARTSCSMAGAHR